MVFRPGDVLRSIPVTAIHVPSLSCMTSKGLLPYRAVGARSKSPRATTATPPGTGLLSERATYPCAHTAWLKKRIRTGNALAHRTRARFMSAPPGGHRVDEADVDSDWRAQDRE